jgi:NAD dependent epimerase/dehydratase family enzyme
VSRAPSPRLSRVESEPGGAVVMRTETELILKSRLVVPAILLEHGFTFTYPDWCDAARDLCRQWNTGHTRAA